MRDTTAILKKLRNLMESYASNHRISLMAYIVPSDDAHHSEYICSCDKRREFISGFDGSAGTAVITYNKALLWTDGRYYQQALKQLDSNWCLMKDGLAQTLSIGAWLAANLPKGSVVGADPNLVSHRVWTPLQEELAVTECVVLPIEENFIDIIWGDERPVRTSNPIFSLDLQFTGKNVLQKWQEVKKEMAAKRTQALVVSALDEIAWFLNLRGSDIQYNPVFFAYLIITETELKLFIDSCKLPSNFQDHKNENQIEISIYDYQAIAEHIKQIADEYDRIWISPLSSYYLNSLVPKHKLHHEITPIAVAKAIKNETEVQGFINCHIRDGVALCKYFAWLENQLSSDEYVDEISSSEKLQELRSEQEYYMGLSFVTMSSAGPNASIIHYHPTEESKRQITNKEIYLCDSGAQYKDGTTDVTRTFHFGEPTEFQKEAYTRVLKGQLNLGSTIFPKKIKGHRLDTIARKPLWDVGMDYGHGTGHGVGHFLNVHEGPMGIGIRLVPDDPGLQENMIISNEPGYYEDGEFGIRIEDIVQVVSCPEKYDFNKRGALTFKTLTMCPKQTKLIKKELLTSNEINLLNEYHHKVWETISPILRDDNDTSTLEWLERETQQI